MQHECERNQQEETDRRERCRMRHMVGEAAERERSECARDQQAVHLAAEAAFGHDNPSERSFAAGRRFLRQHARWT